MFWQHFYDEDRKWLDRGKVRIRILIGPSSLYEVSHVSLVSMFGSLITTMFFWGKFSFAIQSPSSTLQVNRVKITQELEENQVAPETVVVENHHQMVPELDQQQVVKPKARLAEKLWNTMVYLRMPNQ